MEVPPFAEFSEMIQSYKDTQYIEIEFRIGKMNRDIFDTNVGRDTFEKVLRRLNKYTGWESVTVTDDDVYYWDNGIRCVYNDMADSTVAVKKTKVTKKDVAGKSMDVRLGISKEVPVSQPSTDATRHVQRHRTSFVRKNVSIDLTEVHGDTRDIDNENLVTYQIEIEIINPSKLSSIQDIHTVIWKISDVLKICV